MFVIQRSQIPKRALNSEGSQASTVCHCGKKQNVEEDGYWWNWWNDIDSGKPKNCPSSILFTTKLTWTGLDRNWVPAVISQQPIPSTMTRS